jgi:hypothetical protein
VFLAIRNGWISTQPGANANGKGEPVPAKPLPLARQR